MNQDVYIFNGHIKVKVKIGLQGINTVLTMASSHNKVLQIYPKKK